MEKNHNIVGRKYIAGNSVIKNGVFLGEYVENLSDFIGSNDDVEKFKSDILKQEPSGVAQSKLTELDRRNFYGIRKVCNKDGYSTDQILVKSFDSVSWINIDMENYNIEKFKVIKKSQNKAGYKSSRP